MATTYAVDLQFTAKTRELDATIAKLNSFDGAAKRLQRTVDTSKFEALNNAVSVLPGRLGAATSGLLGFTRGMRDAQAQAKAAAAEIAAMQAAINAKKIQLAYKGGIGGEGLKREIAQMEGAMADAGTAGAGMATGLGAAATAGLALGVAAVAVGGAMVKFTNEVDRNRQQLTLFTKDIGVTNQIIASLQRTADATSLGLPGLLESTKTMSAYGIEARNAAAATKMLGDLALGDNEKLQRFAVNFSQIASLGRAYTVDLKQFGMAGIPIFDALSKVTGKSTAEIMKMAEEGKVTYPLVVRALQDLTKEGASFYDGAARGGTDLDRSLNQLIGSWEKLSQIIGASLAPAVVEALNSIKSLVDGFTSGLLKMQSAYQQFLNSLKGKTPQELQAQISQLDKWIANNEKQRSKGAGKVGDALLDKKIQELQGLRSQLQKDLDNFGKPKQGPKTTTDAQDRAKLAADAQAQAERDARDQLSKLRESEAEKIAKIELDKGRQLADARLGYERDLADFRVSQLEKIAELERTLLDERRNAEFKLAQTQADVASGRRVSELSSQILSAKASGQDTTLLEGAKAAEELMNKSARQRAEIQFSSTTRTIELERRLTDFKREAQKALGQMQLAYTRQVDDILRKAGTAISDEMVKGAKAAKEIMESIQMPTPDGGGGGGGKATIASIADTSLNANARAWLAVIRSAEGTAGPNGYRTMFGGGLFSDMSRHPDRVIRSGGYASAAAGAYQFMPDTWRGVGGGAMTPVRQDRAAMALALNRGVNLSTAPFTPQNVARLAPEWASLPTLAGASYYGQPNRSFRSLQGVFNQARGAAPANNIVPTAPRLPAPAAVPGQGNIPTTSPGLEAANNDLKRLEADQKRLDLLRQEQQITEELKGKVTAIISDRQAELKSVQDRNQLEQQTLELMRSGIAPELARQLATNQQLVDNTTKQLEGQRAALEAAVKEKDITAETRAERQKLLDLVNGQIAAQPELLNGLNQEAQQTQALADQRKAMDQAKSDAQGISSTITGGIKDAIKAAVTGGDVKAALSGMLASLGEKFLDMAMRPLEEMLTKGLTNMFNPQALATQANTQATVQNTLALQSLAMSGGGGAGGLGGLFGGAGGILSGLFGGGGGLGAAASGIGFNPIAFTPGLSFFADGGYASGPTPAIVGEGGSGGEYVIPANKMPGAMARWSAGARGEAVINGADPTSGTSGVVADQPPQININGGVLNFNDSQYIRADQIPDIVKQGAKQGEARAIRSLQMRASVRRRVGV